MKNKRKTLKIGSPRNHVLIIGRRTRKKRAREIRVNLKATSSLFFGNKN